MAHQVIWTSKVLSDFIAFGNLNELQSQIMIHRCKNITVIQMSQMFNVSESTIHREIAKIKKIYDAVQSEHPDKFPPRKKSAKDYAEKYVDCKSQNKTEWASKFKKMAEDELVHSTNLHSLAIEEIEQLKKVYVAPESMQEKWDKSHKKYIERTAWIKQMLAM